MNIKWITYISAFSAVFFVLFKLTISFINNQVSEKINSDYLVRFNNIEQNNTKLRGIIKNNETKINNLNIEVNKNLNEFNNLNHNYKNRKDNNISIEFSLIDNEMITKLDFLHKGYKIFSSDYKDKQNKKYFSKKRVKVALSYDFTHKEFSQIFRDLTMIDDITIECVKIISNERVVSVYTLPDNRKCNNDNYYFTQTLDASKLTLLRRDYKLYKPSELNIESDDKKDTIAYFLKIDEFRKALKNSNDKRHAKIIHLKEEVRYGK